MLQLCPDSQNVSKSRLPCFSHLSKGDISLLQGFGIENNVQMKSQLFKTLNVTRQRLSSSAVCTIIYTQEDYKYNVFDLKELKRSNGSQVMSQF